MLEGYSVRVCSVYVEAADIGPLRRVLHEGGRGSTPCMLNTSDSGAEAVKVALRTSSGRPTARRDGQRLITARDSGRWMYDDGDEVAGERVRTSSIFVHGC